MYVEWSDSFSTGVDLFDGQHKKLFGIINDLHKGITSGKGREALLPTLNELANYASYHFVAEEKALQECHYAKYDDHKRQHEGFKAEVLNYINDHMSGVRVMPLDILRFVTEWLKEHIAVSDKAYGPAINAFGAPEGQV
ncbi:MAG: hemerythrin family protein [Nitrospinae bacterium]|nr:hemerythrin family protein [Nitrospinota bacterium]